MITLSQKSALFEKMNRDQRIKEVFQTGDPLYEMISGLSVRQYHYLRGLYEDGHIIKVKQFLHGKLQANDLIL